MFTSCTCTTSLPARHSGDPHRPRLQSGCASTLHDSIGQCYERLRSQGFSIWATALQPESRELYSLDLAKPSALVFGNEMRGVSEAAVTGADGTVFIPMQGMVESLNISVACAVSLYEAMRQRIAAGLYESPQLESGQMESLRNEWLRK
jgi:tRNA (guanosine-2'-O-)-methyltransferase